MEGWSFWSLTVGGDGLRRRVVVSVGVCGKGVLEVGGCVCVNGCLVYRSEKLCGGV